MSKIMSSSAVTKKVLLLAVTFVVYSSSSIFSKSASQYDFLSLPYLLNFCGVLCAMALYAVLWQKVLTFMDLNKAFLCKSITLILILALSYFFFHEPISLNNMIGTVLIVGGICILGWKA